jgi:hypothetical protein
MIKTIVVCDVCEKAFPTEIVEDPVRGSVETVTGFSRTKVWDTRILFPHLCESCAEAIDNALVQFRDEVTMEGLINIRNRKINEERRKKLGTEG